MKGKQYYTTVTILSSKREVYAEQGALVTVVTCQHNNVWIVEDVNGNRFAVNPEKLSETAPVKPQEIKPVDLFNQI